MHRRRAEARTATNSASKMLAKGDNCTRKQNSVQQQKKPTSTCRELCTSCQSRIEDILHWDGEGNNNKSVSCKESEFRVFQTTMPDSAVAMVRQKLVKLIGPNSFAEDEQLAGKMGKELSRFMEDRLGGVWNVIVGQDFAASVIYGANSFLHCGLNSVNYLLFSWQPVGLFSDSIDNKARLY